MSTYSQHPEFVVPPPLRETVERVRSGIESVIVLTDTNGSPLAAIVSMQALTALEERDVAQRSDAAMETSDTAGLRERE